MSEQLTPQELMKRAETLYDIFRNAGFTEETFRELGTAGFFGTAFQKLSVKLKVSLLTIARDYEAQTADRRQAQTATPTETAETPAPVSVINITKHAEGQTLPPTVETPTEALKRTLKETRDFIAQAIPETPNSETPTAQTETADSPTADRRTEETQSGETATVETVQGEYVPPGEDPKAD